VTTLVESGTCSPRACAYDILPSYNGADCKA
jgi:hypothetical protein